MTPLQRLDARLRALFVSEPNAQEPPPYVEHVRSRIAPKVLEPMPCSRCNADTRDNALLYEGRIYCMTCGTREVGR